MWVVLVSLLGCTEREQAPPPPPARQICESRPPNRTCEKALDGIVCVGAWAVECRGGETVERTHCGDARKQCAFGLGCRRCVPGRVRCEGETPERCRDDGNSYETLARCEGDLHCSEVERGCVDLCALAEEERSYIGCDYWAVPTMNSQLEPDFAFALAIANPQAVVARVRVAHDGDTLRELEVPAGEVRDVTLPWVDALKGSAMRTPRSSQVQAGAYRVEANVPVVVHQFNPLKFRRESTFSFTNDASLLLPTHALARDYFVMSRATRRTHFAPQEEGAPTTTSAPGFLAVVAVEAGDTNVQVEPRAHIAPAEEGSVPMLEPGDRWSTTLEQGEVLQLASATPEMCAEGSRSETVPREDGPATVTYCDVGSEFDLTGTRVRSDRKIGVIAGHDCAFVPHDRWACDHLEEAMFPVQAWGREVLLPATQSLRGEPGLVRVLSASDGNRVRFEPPLHDEVILDGGDFVELEAKEDVRVIGDDALMAAQFLVGQDYAGLGTSGSFGEGDPAMSLGIPREQWRSRYALLAPTTFPSHFMSIVAPRGQDVLLDGEIVCGFSDIQGTDLMSVQVEVESGQHMVEAGRPVGVVSYGFAPYTSYMVPGGVDLRIINELE